MIATAYRTPPKAVSRESPSALTLRLAPSSPRPTTDATGNYVFANQPAGNYPVAFDPTTATNGQKYLFSRRA